jgi:hypothetical protein
MENRGCQLDPDAFLQKPGKPLIVGATNDDDDDDDDDDDAG